MIVSMKNIFFIAALISFSLDGRITTTRKKHDDHERVSWGYQKPVSSPSSQTFPQAYFSPHIKEHLLDFTDREMVGIKLTSFRLSDRDFASALLRALARGVKVEVVADKGCLGFAYSQIMHLAQEGVPLYIFPPVSKEGERLAASALMHNKYIIFVGQNLLWTGSFNFTQAANKINKETVIVLNDARIVELYTKEFDLLVKSSMPFPFAIRKNTYEDAASA